jgi:hypothetical protein
VTWTCTNNAVTKPGEPLKFIINKVFEFGPTGDDTVTLNGVVIASGTQLKDLSTAKVSVTGGTGRFLGATGKFVPTSLTDRILHLWVPKL